MTIFVVTNNIQVQAGQPVQPVQITLRDRSGAHTELTLFIEGQSPVAVAFDYHEGEFNSSLPLEPGPYRCRLYVQAYHYGSNNTLSPWYDVQCAMNGQLCAAANGAFNANETDAGFGDFELTVV